MLIYLMSKLFSNSIQKCILNIIILWFFWLSCYLRLWFLTMWWKVFTIALPSESEAESDTSVVCRCWLMLNTNAHFSYKCVCTKLFADNHGLTPNGSLAHQPTLCSHFWHSLTTVWWKTYSSDAFFCKLLYYE